MFLDFVLCQHNKNKSLFIMVERFKLFLILIKKFRFEPLKIKINLLKVLFRSRIEPCNARISIYEKKDFLA